jgi:hypothetical protein
MKVINVGDCFPGLSLLLTRTRQEYRIFPILEPGKDLLSATPFLYLVSTGQLQLGSSTCGRFCRGWLPGNGRPSVVSYTRQDTRRSSQFLVSFPNPQ